MILYDGACQTCEPQESGLCTLKVCISLLFVYYENKHLFRQKKNLQKSAEHTLFLFPTEIFNAQKWQEEKDKLG